MSDFRGEHYFEGQVVEGLEKIAANELRRFFSSNPESQGAIQQIDPGQVKFTTARISSWFLDLKTIAAVYAVSLFDIPRPKALLGDQNFRAVSNLLSSAFELYPRHQYETYFVSAAGRNTATLQRLRIAIGEEVNLPEGREQGDLLIRLRKLDATSDRWEVMVRLTPRPLSTRSWRVCDFEGALNATVAHAMALISKTGRDDVILNLGCGSGSLLIERLAAGPKKLIVGCDNSPDVLTCCQSNLVEAQQDARVKLLVGDGVRLPVQSGAFDVVLADFPFGHHVGSHEENLRLYPELFGETARCLIAGGKFVLLTHEVRLMKSILQDSSTWKVVDILRINLRGLHPRIYVLERK